jgi:hypothetical protein
MTVRRSSIALLGLGLLLLQAGGCRWRAADDFQAALRCGMTPTEVASLGGQFGVASFRPVEEPHRPDHFVTHVLNKGSTFFEFHFDANGLRTVRQGRSVGLTTGTSYEPRVNLCTGQITGSVSLGLEGPPEWAGAEIRVDGERLGLLPKMPGYRMSIGVSSGPHELHILKQGYEPIAIPLDYSPHVQHDEIVLPPPVPAAAP